MNSSHGTRRLRTACVVLAAATLPLLGGIPATAEVPGSPDPTAIDGTSGARLVSSTQRAGQQVDIEVYSPSMQRNIPLQVLRPKDTSTPAPTFYLLNGAGGGEDGAAWNLQTDVGEFFADKHVNVVTPMEGAFSYYTDWREPDPGLAATTGNNGINKWTTFLTEELPPVIDDVFDTTGANSIAAISMTGTSVLDLAIQAPDLYKSVGSYSGCAITSKTPGRQFVKLVVGLGDGNVDNMWGPQDDPEWIARDPYVNADKLPRIPMYISTASGLPGPHDSMDNPRIEGKFAALASQVVVGGIIEASTQYCTDQLSKKTRALGMDNIVYNFRPAGTHSWGYWQDDLHESWPMVARSLGI
ncbi:esterase family protein [Prescottella agglutinans]|uniref:Esterase family protein n=1 Tax=Prescottella agglutinans TaxID=1644129 RepID=A0A3S3AI32_9NOCA|nr:alpha/beta hydrolase family protein [Prescottella agglutinans]RVW10582.1 esterase family protein [Prescottella agglutinans]